MKYNLYRARVTQKIYVVGLYGPKCNAGQSVCMGSGNWNSGFREPSWERTAVTMWRWPNRAGTRRCGAGTRRCVTGNSFREFPNCQRDTTLLLCHTQEEEISL